MRVPSPRRFFGGNYFLFLFGRPERGQDSTDGWTLDSHVQAPNRKATPVTRSRAREYDRTGHFLYLGQANNSHLECEAADPRQVAQRVRNKRSQKLVLSASP